MKMHVRSNLLALFALIAIATSAAAQGTAFTYQGRLFDGGNPANGSYDLRLTLHDALTAGSLIAGPVTNSPVVVSNGLFTTTIDFGAGAFSGPSRFLQIGVRTNTSLGAFTQLSPRQELTPTPYAITAENLDGLLSASQLTGTLPSAVLSGTYSGAVTFNNAGDSFTGNGAGLTGLNASALATGTVPDARLSPNVALLNRSQTFTAVDIFNSGTGAGRLIVSNGFTASNLVDTNVFTGLSLQYDGGFGEGAIMSAFATGEGYLSFYTKASGYSIMKEMSLDWYGHLAIDLSDQNNGALNNSSFAGAGLSFGNASGEGIASKRTPGGNQWGLDFYTGFSPRLSLANNGNLSFIDHSQTLIFPATSGANNPMIEMFASGTGNADRMVIAHSPNYPSWGLQYQDVGDRFNFLSGGSLVFSVELGAQDIRIHDHDMFLRSGTDPNHGLGYRASVFGIGTDGPFLYGYNAGALGTVGPEEVSLIWDWHGNVWISNNCSVATLTIRGGADLAEPFQISSGSEEIREGAVVVIDEENPGHLKLSDRPYDTRVASVVSGANGVNPGVQMQQQGLIEGGKNVALTGRVYVQADSSFGTIKPGDMLTTSSTAGYAMRVGNHTQAQGAILGKAMTGLKQGKGMVLVLVTLQ